MALAVRRPGSGKTSGGYLDGVAGVIKDAVYEAGKKGKNKNGGDWTAISVKLTIQPDGSKETTQYLRAGFLNGGQTISADGRSIVGGEKYEIDLSQQFGKFAMTAVYVDGDENNVREAVDAKVGDSRSLNFIIGMRVTFKRIQDREATIEAGRAKLSKNATPAQIKALTDEQCIEAGKQPGKKGTPNETKKFMLDQLLVGEFHGYTDVAAPATTKKASSSKADKPAAAAVDTAAADAALIAVLTAAGGQIERPKFSPAYLRYAAQQNWTTDQREPIRKLLISDAYVADTEKRGLIVLNGTGKGATLILNPDAVAAA